MSHPVSPAVRPPVRGLADAAAMTTIHLHRHDPVAPSPPLRGAVATDRTSAQFLFAEWDQLRGEPRSVRRARSWDLPGEPPHDLDEVLRRAGYSGDRHCDDADRYLYGLVRIAATDDLAARVVLQRILPGLVAAARRRGRVQAEGQRRVFDELLATSWVLIRTFPVERRTRRIAANLLRDAEYHTYVRAQRLRARALEVLTDELHRSPSDDLDPGRLVVEDPRRELTELLDQLTAAGLAPDDVALLRALGEGESVHSVAGRLRVSDRAVRARRARVIERVRALAGPDQTLPVTASYPASSTAANTAA